MIKLLEDPPEIKPPEEFARYACRCGGACVKRYDPDQDDVRCERCRRWVPGYLPDPDPARTLMPLARKPGRLKHAARQRRRARIAQCAGLGVPVEELCAVFGVVEKAARAACAEFGSAPKRSSPRPNAGKTIPVLAALKAGKTVPEVAEELKLSRARVYQINDQAILAGILPGDGRDAP